MNNQVIVKAHPETNAVITEFEANGKKYGKTRVEAATVSVDKGFVNIRKRSAFITMNEATMEAFKSQSLLKDGQAYPALGKIVRTETRDPQYEGHKAKVIPADEATGREEAPYLLDGAPVYFQDEFTTNLAAQDSLLASENVEVEATVEADGLAA